MKELKFYMVIKETGQKLNVGRICIQCKKVYPWDQLDTFYRFDQIDLFQWDGNDIYEQINISEKEVA